MAKDRKQAKAAERKQKLKSKQLHQERASRIRNRIEEMLELDPNAAIARLAELRAVAPDDQNLFVGYLEACGNAQDFRKMRHACRDWLDRHPDDREVWRSYTGACIEDGYYTMGRQAAQVVIDRWPEWEQAQPCRVILQALDATRLDVTKWMGPDVSDEMLLRHEEVRDALESGHFQKSIDLGTKAIARWPDCQPFRNNLAQALGLHGRHEEAIQASRAALERDPSNFFASSSLTRSLYLLGRDDEAQAALRDMQASPSDRTELWCKIAETLAVMGQESELRDFTRTVIDNNQDRDAEPVQQALLRHYAACAESRLGDEAVAKKLWRDSIQIQRTSIAIENLQDLELPVDERNSAWYFDMQQLVPRALIEEILSECRGNNNEGAAVVMRRLMERRPEIRRMIPMLLERGDRQGRTLAIQICKLLVDEASLDALLAFAQGRWGSLSERTQCTETLLTQGRIQPGQFQTWVDGKPSEVMALGFHIIFEPLVKKPNKLTDSLMLRAQEAMQRHDYPQAVKLFEEIIQLAPNDPIPHFNIASIHQVNRPGYNYRQAIQEIHQRWPDYAFGRMGLATELAKQGEIQAARDLILPIMSRPELHHSEFRMLAICQIEIELAADRIAHAKPWFDRVRQALPDQTDLHEMLQEKIEFVESPSLGQRASAWIKRMGR